MVGLTPAAKRKFRGYSLGMRQRLGIACAMIGDPRVLILDEPANGLDPEGIRWMRDFLRAFATQGRTVFVSSHLLSEMEQLADDVIIIAAGQLVTQGRLQDILAGSHTGMVRVRTPHAQALAAELQRTGAGVLTAPDGALQVTGVDPGAVGRAALAVQVELHELVLDKPDLEQVFLELTQANGGDPMTTTATQPAPATAAPRRNGGALPVRLIKSELLKIWTTNSWWIFGILLVAGTGLTLLINLFVANSQLAEAADLKARGLPNMEGIDASQQALIRERFAIDSDVHRVLANVSANVFTSGQFFGLLFVTVLGASS